MGKMRGFLTWSIQCLIEHDTKIGAGMGPEGLEQIVSRKRSVAAVCWGEGGATHAIKTQISREFRLWHITFPPIRSPGI